jgi:hypothetical protein
MTLPDALSAVVEKVDFSHNTAVNHTAAAPTVQGSSAPDSHQGTPFWSPLTPPPGPGPRARRTA